MRYLLDTDHTSILRWESGTDLAVLTAHLNLHEAEGITVSVVSLHEQALGANGRISQAKSLDEVVRGYALMKGVIELYRRFPLLPFDSAAAALYSDLRARKVQVKTMDLRIASIALAHNLVLVTRNVSDFGKVPNLRTEDWTK
jgi:tRNA(fMet)-specific endonuclease VapC